MVDLQRLLFVLLTACTWDRAATTAAAPQDPSDDDPMHDVYRHVSLSPSGAHAAAMPRGGFLGTVHPSINPAAVLQPAHAPTSASGVAGAYRFGSAMLYNTPSEGGMTLRQSAVFHCQNASVNSVAMLIAPPTEGGVISNPADTDPWVPASEGKTGMVQAAARFSAIARTTCPQATGIVVDDFLQQYTGHNPPPAPPVHMECVNATWCTSHATCVNASCPATQPHKYGGLASGSYCCPQQPNGADCARPACKHESDTNCACCLVPGSAAGCQGALKCSDSPSSRMTPCQTRPKITLADMKEIKAALLGKTVRLDGTVDHASPATTPHLQLGIVWYDFELNGNYDWVRDDGLLDLLDVVSPWVWHQNEATTSRSNYTQLIKTLRTYVPRIPIVPGIYIKNSAEGWVPPSSVSSLIELTTEMYNRGENHPATLIFAGVWLERDNMNDTEARTMGLHNLLAQSYWPWVGDATVSVTDNTTGAPVVGAVVQVHYGGSDSSGPWTSVTRKVTDAAGKIAFSGWAGRSGAVPHTVEVTAATKQARAIVQLKGQERVEIGVGL